MMNAHEAHRLWRNLVLLSALWCTGGACAVVVVVMVVIMMIRSMGW